MAEQGKAGKKSDSKLAEIQYTTLFKIVSSQSSPLPLTTKPLSLLHFLIRTHSYKQQKPTVVIERKLSKIPNSSVSGVSVKEVTENILSRKSNHKRSEELS